MKPEGSPRAAIGKFPYPGHRNMAEVMADEEAVRQRERDRYNRERKSWRRA